MSRSKSRAVSELIEDMFDESRYNSRARPGADSGTDRQTQTHSLADGLESIHTARLDSKRVGQCELTITAKYCDEYVCLSVRLSARISRKLRGQTSPNFLYMLSMVVARSSSGDIVISYVLPVSWMTSRFRTTDSTNR